MNADPIELLVTESLRETTEARTAEGAHPNEVVDTIARLLIKAGSNLRAMKEFGETQRRLQILSQFPLLNTDVLKKLHRITVEHEGVSASADIPLYGIVGLGVSGTYVRANYREEYLEGGHQLNVEVKWGHRREDGKYYIGQPHTCDAVSSREWGHRFLTAAMELVVFFPPRVAYCFLLDVPKLPKRVEEQAAEAKQFGFTDLSVVWGPTSLTLEAHPLPVDPLLIGKMFGQWWILDQWDPTDAEKRLVNTP